MKKAKRVQTMRYGTLEMYTMDEVAAWHRKNERESRRDPVERAVRGAKLSDLQRGILRKLREGLSLRAMQPYFGTTIEAIEDQARIAMMVERLCPPKRPAQRIDRATRACLKTALDADGLIYEGGFWRGRNLSSYGSAFESERPLLDKERAGYRIKTVAPLIEAEWLKCSGRIRGVVPTGALAMPTDHARSLLAQSLLEAGLFVTRSELALMPSKKKEELAVWADSVLAKVTIETPYTVEVFMRSAWRCHERIAFSYRTRKAELSMAAWYEEKRAEILARGEQPSPHAGGDLYRRFIRRGDSEHAASDQRNRT